MIVQNNNNSSPDIADVPLADDGGGIAKRGFNYQDHFTAQKCLEMLQNPDQYEYVSCETHEDVVVKRKDLGYQFYQVKTKSSGAWTLDSLKRGNIWNNFLRVRENFGDEHEFWFVSDQTANSDLGQMKDITRKGETICDQSEQDKETVDELIKRLQKDWQMDDENDAENFFWSIRILTDYERKSGLRAENIRTLHEILNKRGKRPLTNELDSLYRSILALVSECTDPPKEATYQEMLNHRKITVSQLETCLSSVSFGEIPRNFQNPAEQIGGQFVGSHIPQVLATFNTVIVGDCSQFVDRTEAIDYINQQLENSRIVVVLGMSGVGKSSLLQQLYNCFGQSPSVPVYEFPDGLVLLNQLLLSIVKNLDYQLDTNLTVQIGKWIADGNKEDAINLIVHTINQHKCCLYFDSVQCASSNSEVVGFLKILKKRLTDGRLVMATREKLDFYNVLDLRQGIVSEVELTGFTLDETIIFFQKRNIDVDDETTRKIWERYQGLPMAIELAGILLKDFDDQEMFDQLLDNIEDEAVEHLFGEVFQHLPLSIRELLTSASIFHFPFTRDILLNCHKTIFPESKDIL